MLRKRLLVAIFLLPVGALVIALGGWPFATLVALFLAIAAWEYVQLFRAGGYQASPLLVVGGVLLFTFGRFWWGFDGADWMISVLILCAMAYHLITYERGRAQAATDFAVTLGGIFYLGWIGAYLISLRALPQGKWWFLLALPSVWLADSAAFFIGSRFGKHPLTPRLSPKKTWEGYWGGVVVGTLSTAALGALWQLGAPPDSPINPLNAAGLGLAMGILPTLGDLGESMIKRQMGVKDSGSLLPGHGGMFDRLDSWLWGGVIAYYLIRWFFL